MPCNPKHGQHWGPSEFSRSTGSQSTSRGSLGLFKPRGSLRACHRFSHQKSRRPSLCVDQRAEVPESDSSFRMHLVLRFRLFRPMGSRKQAGGPLVRMRRSDDFCYRLDVNSTTEERCPAGARRCLRPSKKLSLRNPLHRPNLRSHSAAQQTSRSRKRGRR